MRTLGKYMVGAGATFGYVTFGFTVAHYSVHVLAKFISSLLTIQNRSLFMSIGSVIRTEGPHNDAWLRARGPPMMLPRQTPLRRAQE